MNSNMDLIPKTPDLYTEKEDPVENAWLEYSQKRKRGESVAIPNTILESSRFDIYTRYAKPFYRNSVPTISNTENERKKIYPFGISEEISFDLDAFNESTKEENRITVTDPRESIVVRYVEPEKDEKPRYLFFDSQNFPKIRTFMDQHFSMEN